MTCKMVLWVEEVLSTESRVSTRVLWFWVRAEWARAASSFSTETRPLATSVRLFWKRSASAGIERKSFVTIEKTEVIDDNSRGI